MNIRKNDRIPVSDSSSKSGENFAEFDLEGCHLRASISDISLKGVGLKFSALTDDALSLIEKTGNIFAKIYIEDVMIFAGLNRSWFVSEGSEGNLSRGGFSFNILSPDDALLLHRVIGIIREKNV